MLHLSLFSIIIYTVYNNKKVVDLNTNKMTKQAYTTDKKFEV